MKLETDGYFHTEFIELLAKRIKPNVYLELGIDEGTTLHKVIPHAKKCIGVDKEFPKFCEWDKSFDYFNMTTEYFFDKNILREYDELDLVFIDADHSYEAVKRDFYNVYRYVAQDGLILLHDTFPKDETDTHPDLCGDCYKFTNDLKNCGFEFMTLPFPPGLTIVRRV